MKKVLFFILLLWCPFSIVSAQFVNFGQDRPSLRWKQIKTDDFQIIYPDFFEENAQKAASIFSLLYHHANTLQLHPKKISIISRSVRITPSTFRSRQPAGLPKKTGATASPRRANLFLT